MQALHLFAQTMQYDTTASSNAGSNPLGIIIGVILAIISIAGMWKVFQKAGQPGWAAIVPFYNIYVLLKIAGRPGWWLVLYIIPLVSIVVHLLVSLDVAKAFGKSAGFGIFALWLFSFVGFPVLGFGEATYKGATTNTHENKYL